jgi:hypothetical protein
VTSRFFTPGDRQTLDAASCTSEQRLILSSLNVDSSSPRLILRGSRSRSAWQNAIEESLRLRRASVCSTSRQI